MRCYGLDLHIFLTFHTIHHLFQLLVPQSRTAASKVVSDDITERKIDVMTLKIQFGTVNRNENYINIRLSCVNG